MMERGGACGVIEWGWAGRALEGTSGDCHAVVPFAGGALAALIDGLGHGTEAAAAAGAALPVLERTAGAPLVEVLDACHAELRRTRGAVMTLASFDARSASLSWIGVGNVDGTVFRAARDAARDEALPLRGGVVGFRLPSLQVRAIRIWPGDLLVMVTDGIRSAYSSALPRELPPQELAETIVARYASGSDDAHVLVARYLGEAP
ncbi:MAG: SpoIIE family protein phosphatase [Polyangiaceae bacterium]